MRRQFRDTHFLVLIFRKFGNKMSNKIYRTGIDIGSTTIKAVITNSLKEIVFTDYRRHIGKISDALLDLLADAERKIGDKTLSLAVTGSAGMGLSEKYDIPFVQELIASAEFSVKSYPEIKTLIDIGGEDSKIIFFNEHSAPDIRMNGTCAGGTGSFIDQMADLLNITLPELNQLAGEYKEIHPIASRCGVFAKTDVQNLLSREIPRADVAASIFHAVALQIKNSLLRGFDALPKVVFSGGPLTFLSNLRLAVLRVFEFDESDILHLDAPELLPASGAGVVDDGGRLETTIGNLRDRILNKGKKLVSKDQPIDPLFANKVEADAWMKQKHSVKAERIDLKELHNRSSYLGVDSGSTTTKIVLMDEQGRIAYTFYGNNGSDPIGTVKNGLSELRDRCFAGKIKLNIIKSAVTGYGEDLIKSAYDMDYGIVETIAHYSAAKVFDKDVSFILDIGGQDMKAIFVKDGIIKNIEINEACSSGCGSFIETFANSMNYPVEKFAEIACESSDPCDLGTRCTVFMNSKVKQSFREGSGVDDISAGLAYSVINNCLHKVLKIFDKSILGDHIVVQGGTFKNPAVHRAFEKVLGTEEVLCPDISELMGAYGSALTAREFGKQGKPSEGKMRNVESIDDIGHYKVKYIHCKGCENLCTVSKLVFENGNSFFTGNRCENIFTNNGEKVEKGFNMPEYKYNLLFDRAVKPKGKPLLRLGVPRALNIYEDFPFWAKLFTESGIEIVLSGRSNAELCDKGAGTVMSDNICFPAKLAHGHIFDLIERGIDRIFYPMVTFAKDEYDDVNNCFNCPVVTGYPDVIRSSIDPVHKYGVEFDSPNFTFKDEKLLRRNCKDYLLSLGVPKKKINKAIDAAIAAQNEFKRAILAKGDEVLTAAEKEGRKILLFAGRPYHIDPLVHHGLPGISTEFGVDVLTEDSMPFDKHDSLFDSAVLTQWAYPNRLYKSAKQSARRKSTEFVQLNNFGCGPDSIAIDELKEILESYNRNFNLLRIDEHSSTGSLKLRIRSLIESLKLKDEDDPELCKYQGRTTTKVFEKGDKGMTILAPFFSPFHSGYLSAPFTEMGYNVETLPQSDNLTIETGLKYVNNEICYPAILTIGDLIKALKSGKYDLENTAVMLSQSGGQCRASNYVSLLKKALVKNGYKDIPVVGLSITGGNMNEQPGFIMDKGKFIKSGVLGIMYGDCLQDMYYSTAPREINKGDSAALVSKYDHAVIKSIGKGDTKKIIEILTEAVREFNAVEVEEKELPVVGVVGEIYVKYNPVGNRGLVNELVNSGVEVVMSPLIGMFSQWFVNAELKKGLHLERNLASRIMAKGFEKIFNNVGEKFENAMKVFRYYRSRHNIHEIAANAEKVMDMSDHYYGEGWLIAGEAIAFAEEGIKDVLCVQPFGCIANHIVARGIERNLKKHKPELNMLFLDIDPGVSEVNLHNRMHLLVKNAKENINGNGIRGSHINLEQKKSQTTEVIDEKEPEPVKIPD